MTKDPRAVKPPPAVLQWGMLSRLQQLNDCASTLQALRACQVMEPGASDSPGYAERHWRFVALGVVDEFLRVLQTYPRLQGIMLTWNKVDQEYLVTFQSQGIEGLAQDAMSVYRDMDCVKATLNTGLSVVCSAAGSVQEPFLTALFERLASSFVVDPGALLPMIHRAAGPVGLAVMRQSLLDQKLAPQSLPSLPKVRL